MEKIYVSHLCSLDTDENNVVCRYWKGMVIIMKNKLMRWLSRFGMGIALFTFIVLCNFILFFSYARQGNLNGNYGTLLQANEMDNDTRIEYGKAIAEQTRRLSII